eukprot:CAMPEP_0197039168 /NCGR_PEP_ID=MMETSP1384-20130603/16007_1 /TAXON_ID=29189 /ORGANISM="Ammonia sp." /LENGTH=387 /DNA_ID=CAMNT_0042469723 /DNA_START=21 /DNA_END=1184 /DNA_ORIENTATION=-
MSSHERLKMKWEVSPDKIADFKEHGVELQSDSFQLDGHEFVLCCRASEKHRDESEIVLLLKSLPQQIGAVKLNVTISTPQLSYTNQFADTILTLVSNRLQLFDQGVFDVYDVCIKDVIPLNDATQRGENPVTFECDIEFLVIYDLYGGVFSSRNKAIFRKPSEDDNKLVFGYLDEINGFDIDYIWSTPLAIYELIYKYYISILNLTKAEGESTKFVWDFHNRAEVETFVACKHGDVITSSKLYINGCCFYFELTPNGWSHGCPEDKCALWLAVYSLPPKIRAVNVSLFIKCEDVEYAGDRTFKLSTPDLGAYSMTSMSFMERSKFLPLKKFQFEMTVQIHELLEQENQELSILDAALQRIINESPLSFPSVPSSTPPPMLLPPSSVQ